MTTPDRVDALFVVNQDTVHHIEKLIERHRCHSVLVLTTQRLFPSEQARLERSAPHVTTHAFADFLTDGEMARCDEVASEDGHQRLRQQGVRGYADYFMRSSVRAKNELVRAKVLAQFRPQYTIHADGLGIDAAVWSVDGGNAVEGSDLGRSFVALVGRARYARGGEMHILSMSPDSGSRHRPPAVVLGAIKRLRLESFVVSESRRLPRLVSLVSPALGAYLCDRWVRSVLPSEKMRAEFLLCTTVHEYDRSMSAVAERLGRELFIIVDGHHPSNYPETYLPSFGAGRFVSANHAAAQWFIRHGRAAQRSLWFQKPVMFQQCRSTAVQRVMLVLNHAGDWTALVNRSDTDALVRAFIDLAALRSDKEFVIRLHPTMATSGHEGPESMQRLRNVVAQAGVPNLHVSHATLSEDLARGDFYLSEYSQVLVDAWADGKLGMAVNLTGRRSFMVDYEQLGFRTLSSERETRDLFTCIDRVVPDLVNEQNLAVQRFNVMQSSWERAPS